MIYELKIRGFFQYIELPTPEEIAQGKFYLMLDPGAHEISANKSPYLRFGSLQDIANEMNTWQGRLLKISKKNISTVINELLKIREIPNDLKQKLSAYNAKFPSLYEGHLKKKQLPKKAKFFKNTGISDYEIIGTLVDDSDPSHSLAMAKTTKSKKLKILKIEMQDTSGPQAEAFHSFTFKLLLGDRAPKVTTVFNENNERIGALIEKFPNFLPADKILADLEKNPQRLLDTEMAKVWIADYLEEDTDVHPFNYGFIRDAQGKEVAVKIDYDRVGWPLTCKYQGYDPLREKENGPSSNIKPIDTFPREAEDIQADMEAFPLLAKAKPERWPDQSFSQEYLEKLREGPRFSDQINYVILKRLLLDENVFKSIAQATFSKESLANKFVEHKVKRTEYLTAGMLNVKNFNDYLHKKGAAAFEQIEKDFEQYNSIFKKGENGEIGKNEYMRIDIASMRINYEKLMEASTQKLEYLEQKYYLCRYCADLREELKKYQEKRNKSLTHFTFFDRSLSMARLNSAETANNALKEVLKRLNPKDKRNLNLKTIDSDILHIIDNALMSNREAENEYKYKKSDENSDLMKILLTAKKALALNNSEKNSSEIHYKKV